MTKTSSAYVEFEIWIEWKLAEQSATTAYIISATIAQRYLSKSQKSPIHRITRSRARGKGCENKLYAANNPVGTIIPHSLPAYQREEMP